MEQQTDETHEGTEPHVECVSGSSDHADQSNSSGTARTRSQRVRRRKKRRPELRFIPPSYQFKEEMRQILCNDLGMGEHYAQLVLTL
ncbi:unnamed protein product [Echinostoma caproni]|uniref:Protein BEX3 n=1 Tax=Echinostoma caproni TaxID=27848 RepID=A0A183ALA4_9TREM|nr:unnamed protein product [Echinostoma caproni]